MIKTQWIKNLASSYAQHPWRWVALLLITLIPSAYLCSQLSLQSDFKTLLPQDKASVKEIDRVVEKVGGVGTLILIVESDNYKATEKFIDDLVPKLQELPKPYVRFVDYNTKDIRAFYEKNKYLFIDYNDLKEIHRRLKRKIEYEKIRNNPFFFSLEDQNVEFDVSDIENKYKSKTTDYDNYVDGYYFSKDRNVAAVIVQPYGTATGTKFSKDLISKIDGIIKQMDPTKYDPSMKVNFRGKYKRVLEEYSQLIKDMLETLALCLGLVALSIFLYFFRIRSIFLLSASLIIGSAWAFAITKLTIGYLNTQTAFLGSIIVGNGVNTGIVLLARYFEERKKNITMEQMIFNAISTTYPSTFAAAMTTCFAFAALHFSELSGLRQFGFIGTIGMFLCWVATYLFLPPLLVITENILPMWKKDQKPPRQWEDMFEEVADFVTTHPKTIAGLTIAAISMGLTTFLHFLPNSLEYDFSKLKNKIVKPPAIVAMDTKVDSIFPQSQTPSVILLNDEKEALGVCDKVMHREDQIVPTERTIESCKTMYDYLPEKQAEKLEELKKIKKTLQDHSLGFLKGRHKELIDEFRKSVDANEVTLSDLPTSIQNRFREMDGRLGRLVYVFPRQDANLTNGKKLIQFSDALSDIRLDDGSLVRSSGDSAIFADILRGIKVDGPKTTIMAFIFVVIIVVLMFRNMFSIGYVLGGLLVGTLLMLGFQSIFDIKLNFFNFIALPVTFGIGVDYGVNLFQRYRLEGRGSIHNVIQKMGGAITLCSITTVIGYASLVVATNQALVSFGWLALIGEVTCIFATIIIMPAVIHMIDSYKKKKGKI